MRHVGFVDPSDGSLDGMTLALAHAERDGTAGSTRCARSNRRFLPQAAVSEFAFLLRSYRVTKVCGDRYGGEWPAERVRAHGRRAVLCPAASDVVASDDHWQVRRSNHDA